MLASLNSTYRLQQQFPYRLLKDDPHICEWLQNDAHPFAEPFFDETISRLKYSPDNRRKFKMLAHIDMLEEFAANTEQRDPSAIIFHISRCGSTLFSQMLSTQLKYMVLAEVPFFDELLRLPFKEKTLSKAKTVSLFHAALQLYIQASYVRPEKLFIKADSWHLHFYEELRILYPAVPFLLLYRHPMEVLRSQQRRRGIQSVPGMIEPGVFGFSEESTSHYDLDKYMSDVLQSYFEKMIRVAGDSKSILINYNEGPMAGLEKILTAAGAALSTADLKRMEERAGFHGKYPGQLFSKESMDETTYPFMLTNIDLYRQLDAIRLAKV
jgi:hypothetical protein